MRVRHLPVVALLLLSTSYLAAQVSEEEDNRDIPLTTSIVGADSSRLRSEVEDYTVVSLRVDLMVTPGSGTFFDSYPLLFGTERELGIAVMPAIGGRGTITDHLRWTMFGSYVGTGMSDIYDGFRLLGDSVGGMRVDTLVPAAQIQEELSVTGFALLGGLEYSPVASQFSSYIGASAGLGFLASSWFTTLRTFGNQTYSRPRINLDDTRVYPAVRLYSGVDLRFDRTDVNRSIVRGVFVEAAWLWLPVTADYFGPIRDLSQNLPLLPQERSATLDVGGFSVGIGINLQLIPE